MIKNVQPYIIGISSLPYTSLENFSNILESKFQHVIVKLDSVAREILTSRPSDITLQEAIARKNEIWKVYGKSYIVQKAITDWIPWVEGHIENQLEHYAIINIETLEEVNYLRKKYGNEFKLIAVCPPREIRLNRFVDQTGKSQEQFVELEGRLCEHGLGDVILSSDFIVTVDDNEDKINEIFLKCGLSNNK